MRIRNRPAPSIYHPPPDLNFNRRSFHSPPSQPKQLQLLRPSVINLQAPDERRLRGVDDDRCSDRTDFTTNFVFDKKMSPDATAADGSMSRTHDDNNDNDDSNNTTGSCRKNTSIDDDTGVQLQPFSYIKGTVRKGATGDKRSSRIGAVTMDGSRCSRVNGRGWRCGQQTLVGYSLCEHHLGKSRLRSLSSVKNVTTNNIDNFSMAPINNKKKQQVEETDDDDDDEPLLICNMRKKSRIGTVKARSLSSLLGQTSQTTNGVGVSQPLSAHKKKCR